MSNNSRKKSSTIFVIFAAGILWYVLSIIVSDPKLFPGPLFLLNESFPSVALFGNSRNPSYWGSLYVLFNNSLATISRIIIGLPLGVFAGILIGLGIHYFPSFRKGNSILLAAAKNIPPFALIPLFLQWFGGNNVSMVLYVAFAISLVTATNAYEAVFHISPSLVSFSRLLGADKLQTFTKVIAIAIQPEMIGSLRNVVGLAWAFSLGAEYMSASSGIGSMLSRSYLYGNMGQMMVFGIVYVILGYGSFVLAKKIEYFLRRWQ
jgi:ABC-type nitrate/sulfonate/bicarbonate transport system permease component